MKEMICEQVAAPKFKSAHSAAWAQAVLNGKFATGGEGPIENA
jgi:hypothetical protein